MGGETSSSASAQSMAAFACPPPCQLRGHQDGKNTHACAAPPVAGPARCAARDKKEGEREGNRDCLAVQTRWRKAEGARSFADASTDGPQEDPLNEVLLDGVVVLKIIQVSDDATVG